jgi:integrase
VLHTALELAVKWQRIGGNPAHALDPPKAEPYEIATLSTAESRRLMAVAGRDLRSQAVLIGLHLGLREGEVLGLRWRDLDLDANRVSVRQTVNQLQGLGLVLRATPKNKSSRRAVTLTEGARAAFRQARATQAEQRLAAGSAWIDQDLIFTTPIGDPLNPQWLRDHFRGMLDAAGIKRVRFHDLRHSHATLMLQNGEHPKVVSERLGHSKVGITLDLYSHVLPNVQTEAAERFDRLLGTGSGARVP